MLLYFWDSSLPSLTGVTGVTWVRWVTWVTGDSFWSLLWLTFDHLLLVWNKWSCDESRCFCVAALRKKCPPLAARTPSRTPTLDQFLSSTTFYPPLKFFFCLSAATGDATVWWCPSIKLSLFLVLEFKSLFEPIYYLHGCVTVMLAVIQREKTEKPKLPKQLERIAICEGISNSNARGNLLSLIKWLGW